jgi:hypothetical protein
MEKGGKNRYMDKDHQKKLGQIKKLYSKKELLEFKDRAIEGKGKPYEEVFLGNVEIPVREHIKNKFGYDLNDITTDSGSVWHAHKKPSHNLESDDILHATGIINTSDNIAHSDRNHQDSPVLLFTKDIDGEITVMGEARAGKKGWR